MKIYELIEKLQQYDEFAEVLIEDRHNGGKCKVDVIIDNFDSVTLL